jgi:hypothetical protein
LCDYNSIDDWDQSSDRRVHASVTVFGLPDIGKIGEWTEYRKIARLTLAIFPESPFLPPSRFLLPDEGENASTTTP